MTNTLVAEIVLVEDNLRDVQLAMRAFRKSALINPIHVARDGEEAMDYIFCEGAYASRRIEDRPRLVLLDLKLPKVDGLEVLRRIKSDDRTRSIPVVILTSSLEQRDVVSSYEFGTNSYIVKPISFDQFQQVVQQLGQYWMVLNYRPGA